MTSETQLGELLRSFRTDAALTIEMLAERSGISDRAISDIERGVSRTPQQRTLHALADALSLDAHSARTLFRAARAGSREIRDGGLSTTIAPAALPDLTGRGSEIDFVVEYLGSRETGDSGSKVAIICGAPGIGKTTTATAAMRRLAGPKGNALFVDLLGLNRVPLTPFQVLQDLLAQTIPPRPRSPRNLNEAAAAWAEVTRELHPVVVLDNTANEAQVRPAIASSVDSCIIVTSRRSLVGLEAAARVTLQPLPEADGVALLERIIPPGQRTQSEVRELARLCGDVPLALRIAGNRIAAQPTWSTADFIARMRLEEQRLRALTAGDLGVEAAFASSYENLDVDQQDLYRSLAMIDGPTFDARVVAALMAIDVINVQMMLDELTDLGLVEARGGNRYRLHDLARLFTASRLRAEVDRVLQEDRADRLRRWLMTSAGRAGRWFEQGDSGHSVGDRAGLGFADADSARRWLQAESSAWFAAFTKTALLGDHETVLRVADSLHWFSDLWVEWGRWHELFAISAASAVALNTPSAAAVHFGYLAWADIVEVGDFTQALSHAVKARRYADESGDARQRGWARFYVGWAHDRLGASEQAIFDAQSALAYLQKADDKEGILQVMSLLAAIYHSLANTERAIVAHHELLDQIESMEGSAGPSVLTFTRSSVQHLLANEYRAIGALDSAAMWAHAGLRDAIEVGYQRGIVMNHLTLARVYLSARQSEAARQHLDLAERISHEQSLSSFDTATAEIRAQLALNL